MATRKTTTTDMTEYARYYHNLIKDVCSKYRKANIICNKIDKWFVELGKCYTNLPKYKAYQGKESVYKGYINANMDEKNRLVKEWEIAKENLERQMKKDRPYLKSIAVAENKKYGANSYFNSNGTLKPSKYHEDLGVIVRKYRYS